MSSISMGKTSVEAAHSASEKTSGAGSPDFVQSASTGATARSAAVEASRTTISTLRSERPFTYVPRAAEP